MPAIPVFRARVSTPAISPASTQTMQSFAKVLKSYPLLLKAHIFIQHIVPELLLELSFCIVQIRQLGDTVPFPVPSLSEISEERIIRLEGP